jgi:HupE / UreJ protein
MIRSCLALLAAASLSIVVPKFVGLGVAHILPGGLDHILFILGLFFLTRQFEALLLQITLFTMAHSLTLALSLYGVVDAPTSFVEIAIALSIAFVAADNLYDSKLHHWRPWIVFGSGLVHGLGFAHTFSDHRVSADEYLPALFSFNVGIELGQLAVVGLAFACVAAWWRSQHYMRRIARPASAIIGVAGLLWVIERVQVALG